MALKIQKNGDDVYVKVATIKLVTDEQMVAYVSKNGGNVEQYSLNYDYSKAYVPQAYTHLKTLPEFAGAIDC